MSRSRPFFISCCLLCAVLAAGCSEDDAGRQADGGDGPAGIDLGPDAPAVQTVSLFADTVIYGASGKPNRQKATAQVTLPSGTWSKITLSLELKTGCHLPRAWPYNDACDPWDRLLYLIVDDAKGTALELLRAITPFGGNKTYTADVTDYAAELSGSRTLTAYISTYADPAGSAAGKDAQWKVSATLTYERGTPARQVLSVFPLFFAKHDSKTTVTPVSVTVPSQTTSGLLRLRTTGHGAVGSPPCDEFCKKRHTVTMDGTKVLDVQPWMECKSLCVPDSTQTYCSENPYGAVSSVLAPRANWCPGHESKPYEVAQKPLGAGSHTVSYAIENVQGSFQISLDLVAYR